MSTLVTTSSGWRHTARSIRWAQLVVAPSVTCGALVAVAAVGGRSGGAVGLVAETGFALSAIAAAVIADDATRDAAPATPTEAPARLAARATLAVPTLVLGYLAVVAVQAALAPGGGAVDVLHRAGVGLGLGSVALGAAAVGGKVQSAIPPSAAGIGVGVCLVLVMMAAPTGWLDPLPPVGILWPTALLAGALAVAVASREPAG